MYDSSHASTLQISDVVRDPGTGPWDTPEQYYSTLVCHKLQVAEKDAGSAVREGKSFSLPQMFAELIQRYKTGQTGNYGLVNRDFGAHNVLVDDEFSVIGLIGVMAAPAEMVAQLPFDMGLDRPIPGRVETGEFALKRLEHFESLLPQYVNAVRKAVAEQETKLVIRDTSGIADLLTSDAASIAQGLNAYSQHQAFVNDSWMAAYEMLEKKKEGGTAY